MLRVVGYHFLSSMPASLSSYLRILSLIVFFLIARQGLAQDSAAVTLIYDTNYIFRDVQTALANSEYAYRLNLSKRKLKEIPPDVFKLKNLRELDLSKNKIDSLPAGIGELTNLRKLNISSNNLELLPDEIGNLTKLTYLGLNRNRIVALPSTIGDMEDLEVLEMWDNELYRMPEEISKLKKLKMLELRGILFSDEEGMRIDSLLPNTRVMMSPTCNCQF